MLHIVILCFLSPLVYAVLPGNENSLCNANDDEFPPDDLMEDDLIETQMPEESIIGQKEVKANVLKSDHHCHLELNLDEEPVIVIVTVLSIVTV